MKISITGSTGSIGRQTLEVIERHPERFEIVGLSAYSDWQTLLSQIEKFKPLKACIINKDAFYKIKESLPKGCNTEIITGDESICEIVSMPETELAVISTVGISGLYPVISALKSGKEIALATKESLVAGGNLVMSLAREKNKKIRPIDSEHSAVFQCIKGDETFISKIILTSSGGPFRKHSSLSNITVDQVLAHPTWKMGRKITVDCATLMNKGFEVIEAKFLFDLDIEQIEVMVHPQSIIHSLVEFCDGSIIAQMSNPDMRIPISYALSLPERLQNNWTITDLAKIGTLTFENPNKKLFPCLNLAYEALRLGKTFPTAINGANEEAVNAFLSGKIEFSKIPIIIETVLESHKGLDDMQIENIIEADSDSRRKAATIINTLS